MKILSLLSELGFAIFSIKSKRKSYNKFYRTTSGRARGKTPAQKIVLFFDNLQVGTILNRSGMRKLRVDS